MRLIDPEWLSNLRTRCQQMGALVIVDEIQVGLGRTASLWGFEQSPLKPDMMTLAKPLAGGLPIGAVLVTDAVASAIYPGCHGTTFGGGPFVTGLASEVFDEVSDPGFLARVKVRGEYLHTKLTQMVSSLPGDGVVSKIRGRGLIWALELTIPAQPIREALADRGVLVATAGANVLRLLPPLIVSQTAIDEVVSVITDVLLSSAQ